MHGAWRCEFRLKNLEWLGMASMREQEAPKSTPLTRIVLVVAGTDNGVIGRGGDLPWRLPTDLQYFRSVTLGKPIVMGRKTFTSIGKPLSGRHNIVISRDAGFAPDGVQVARSVDEALAKGRQIALESGVEEVAVIGGSEIFSAALEHADRIYLTEVHADVIGDVKMPGLDRSAWQEISRQRREAGPRDDHEMSFVVLDRK